MIYKNQHFFISYFDADLQLYVQHFDLPAIAEKVSHYEFSLL